MIDTDHRLPVVRQAQLLELSRSLRIPAKLNGQSDDVERGTEARCVVG